MAEYISCWPPPADPPSPDEDDEEPRKRLRPNGNVSTTTTATATTNTTRSISVPDAETYPEVAIARAIRAGQLKMPPSDADGVLCAQSRVGACIVSVLGQAFLKHRVARYKEKGGHSAQALAAFGTTLLCIGDATGACAALQEAVELGAGGGGNRGAGGDGNPEHLSRLERAERQAAVVSKQAIDAQHTSGTLPTTLRPSLPVERVDGRTLTREQFLTRYGPPLSPLSSITSSLEIRYGRTGMHA
jgi:hypothetical protein